MKDIVVVEYDAVWAEQFAHLCTVIWPVVDDIAISIEHVGSTSVPGLAAKPIIDASVVVPDEERVKTAIQRLAQLGYVHRGNLGIEGREAFHPPPTMEKHHLYLCPQGSLGIKNHLAVRDYLRQHPRAAQEYGELKKKLAVTCGGDIDAYIDGKTDFILGILAKSSLSADDLRRIENSNKLK